MDELAVKVDNVSKVFKLSHEKQSSIKSVLVNFLRPNKGYELQQALKDVSLEIKKGEFFGIVGRNGSGKSTLLKIIAGIYQPTEGTVGVNGKLVPFIELGVGFNPELTGRENVYLNGALLGFSDKEINKMYRDIVKFAELERFMDQKLKNYSSGMQVRLAFSMAVRAEADVLLIDEVLAVGDADFQRKCFQYFKELKRDKKTVIFVTHDMDAVREFCDRAILIEDSQVIHEGAAGKIASRYSDLFTETAPSLKASNQKGGMRGGQGSVRVKKLSLEKSVLTAKDLTLKLKVILEAFRENENLMTGLRIKNSFGQFLHESNTWNEQKKVPDLPIGQTREVTWEFPNIYSDGQYVIDVYVYGENNEVLDIWDNAISFTVKRPRNRGQLVSLNPKITVK